MSAEKIIEEFKKSGKRHIFITGSRSMGKTALCKELSVLLNANVWTADKALDETFLSFLMTNQNDWIAIDEIHTEETNEYGFDEEIEKQLLKSRCILVFKKNEALQNYLLQFMDAYVIDLDRQKYDISCVVMASGFGTRFGSNKLLADFRGKTLIEHILDTIPYNLLKEVILVTRYKEIEELSKKYPVNCIVHDLPRQSDTIRIGMDHVTNTKGCMFLTCDQPLRTTWSLRKLIVTFHNHKDSMVRLGYHGVIGNPVIFPSKYYEELKQLRPGQKGSTVIKAHEESMIVVQADHGYELADTDTMDDLIRLSKIAD